jgi:hypothetical protein
MIKKGIILFAILQTLSAHADSEIMRGNTSPGVASKTVSPSITNSSQLKLGVVLSRKQGAENRLQLTNYDGSKRIAKSKKRDYANCVYQLSNVTSADWGLGDFTIGPNKKWKVISVLPEEDLEHDTIEGKVILRSDSFKGQLEVTGRDLLHCLSIGGFELPRDKSQEYKRHEVRNGSEA